MKQLYALIAMLMMASVAFTGCVSDDGDTTDTVVDDTNDGTDDGTDDGTIDDGTDDGTDDETDDGTVTPVGTDAVSTLDTIIERGSLKCGVKDSQYGMGYLQADGTYTGLDIEYCKAVAAAIGVDTIEYILATGSNRFELLASEEIDVLIRTTTWTTSRDAELNADFAGINFYDGQGILVNKDAFPDATSALMLDGAKICVGIGTTTEGNIADYFAVNGMTYDAVNSDDAATAKAQFEDGSCDAWTGDMSAMVAQKFGLDTTAVPNSAIMPELLSKEPLAAATRDNDDDWNDVVTWVWYGMLTAEELGITGANYASADLTIPANDRLLNNNLGLGTETNPLAATWMQSVLAAVGNYEEAYTESFCTYDDSGNCLIDRAGSQNAPYWEGGLQYAPPMR